MSDVEMTGPRNPSNYIEAFGQHGSKFRIRFKGGKTFDYDDAAHHHGPMLEADSAGKYFHANIKGQHPFTEVKE